MDDQNDKEKLSVELVTRIQQGDQQAEHQLIKRYSARIDMILRRHCHDATQVSDLRQEVFIAALKKLRKEGLKQPAQLSAFLHRIAFCTVPSSSSLTGNKHPARCMYSPSKANVASAPTINRKPLRFQATRALH